MRGSGVRGALRSRHVKDGARLGIVFTGGGLCFFPFPKITTDKPYRFTARHGPACPVAHGDRELPPW